VLIKTVAINYKISPSYKKEKEKKEDLWWIALEKSHLYLPWSSKNWYCILVIIMTLIMLWI